MAGKKGDDGAWMQPFLGALEQGMVIPKACVAAGVSPGTAYYHRNRNSEFAAAWADALSPRPATPEPVALAAETTARNVGWRIIFLEALVETSNVTASAARAGVALDKVYKARRNDQAFAAKWRTALHEGYDNLEMELLGYFRSPQPDRKLDVASALRLLTAHRETVARERALREDDDEQAVLDSIDRFIEDMRQRRFANEAILLEDQTDDGPDNGQD